MLVDGNFLVNNLVSISQFFLFEQFKFLPFCIDCDYWESCGKHETKQLLKTICRGIKLNYSTCSTRAQWNIHLNIIFQ